MAKRGVTTRSSKKQLNLDYSYGEEKKDIQQDVEDYNPGLDLTEEEELVIAGSKKAEEEKKLKDEEFKAKARAFQQRKIKNQKYLGYSDFLNNEERDLNGYKFDENDDFNKLDETGWNIFIGFLSVRLIAPILLILHGIGTGLAFWKIYEFDFSNDSVLIKNNLMPWIAGIWSLNLFIVHGLTKYLFRKNYYKLRTELKQKT